uniref:Uncharacterized protein n=1 Tax=Aegilops tauschii subsp. strangulata TaxID=200361 RepID=A0A453GC19_AEGTS
MQMGDRCIRVTIHHCFFDSMRPIYAVQQGPPLQQNYTRDWGIYAVCDIVKAQVTHLSMLFHMLATHTL